MNKKITPVIVDQNLLEQIPYQNDSLPVSEYHDYFDNFINGEFNYHWHDDFEFGIVLKGSLEYTFHQAHQKRPPQILNEGEGVFVNTQALHTARQFKPSTIMYGITLPVNFFGLQLSGILHQKYVLPVIHHAVPGLFLMPDRTEDRAILNTLRDLYALSPDSADYELLCLEYLCRIWRNLLPGLSQVPGPVKIHKSELVREERLRLMIAYIHTHYSQGITIQDIADSACIGKSECFRCFRIIADKTPMDYLVEYRLSKASQLLEYTDGSVFDICFSCGFNSPSYFSKLFKDHFGISPSQFRKYSRRTVKEGESLLL